MIIDHFESYSETSDCLVAHAVAVHTSYYGHDEVHKYDGANDELNQPDDPEENLIISICS